MATITFLIPGRALAKIKNYYGEIKDDDKATNILPDPRVDIFVDLNYTETKEGEEAFLFIDNITIRPKEPNPQSNEVVTNTAQVLHMMLMREAYYRGLFQIELDVKYDTNNRYKNGTISNFIVPYMEECKFLTRQHYFEFLSSLNKTGLLSSATVLPTHRSSFDLLINKINTSITRSYQYYAKKITDFREETTEESKKRLLARSELKKNRRKILPNAKLFFDSISCEYGLKTSTRRYYTCILRRQSLHTVEEAFKTDNIDFIIATLKGHIAATLQNHAQISLFGGLFTTPELVKGYREMLCFFEKTMGKETVRAITPIAVDFNSKDYPYSTSLNSLEEHQYVNTVMRVANSVGASGKPTQAAVDLYNEEVQPKNLLKP